MLYATTTSNVVVVLQYVTPYICTGACMYSTTLQCIANFMSTFHLYPHSEVIASSFTERFEDMLRWLYTTDSCKHWRAWSREKFVEHLRLLYPQLSNAADKSYLEMIEEIPFEYNLDYLGFGVKVSIGTLQNRQTLRLSYHCGRSRGSKNFAGENQHP